jgi:hypothetical protein
MWEVATLVPDASNGIWGLHRYIRSVVADAELGRTLVKMGSWISSSRGTEDRTIPKTHR